MDYEAGAELGLEPGGLRGHDVACVSNVDDLLHAHGIEGEGDLHLAVVDATFQLAEATDAADEVDALVSSEVLDAEHLVEDKVREDGDVEHADGVVVVVGTGLGGHLVPVAVEIHAVLMQLGGLVDLGAHVSELVALAHGGDELLLGEAVEVLDHAVVVDDVELVVGEDDGHEVVVLLLAGVVGVLLLLLLSHEGGGGAAVVAVGDVHGGNLLVEDVDELGDGGLVVDDPEAMAEAVFLGDEVIDGLLGGDAGHDLVDAGDGGVGEEDGLDVGVGDAHVFHAVLFLVLAGELVFLDNFVDIVLAVGAGDDAVLPLSVGILGVHALGVDVEFLLFIFHQPAEVLEQVVVLDDLEVHFGRVLVGAFGEVDFSLGDVEEAVGVALALDAGFFGVEYVVGT